MSVSRIFSPLLVSIAWPAASAVCPGMEHGTPPENLDVVPDAATYDAALRQLDIAAVIADLEKTMSNSNDCWPADYGNYGPLMVRLAWHCSGTYRNMDGRGGCAGGRQRFEPERSWPDNTNLDKARALLWPIKEKFGDGLSWGDLFTLAGTVAIKSMGGPAKDFCVGRIDDPSGKESEILGPGEEQERLTPCQVQGLCKKPLGSSTVGLIYVNPEGPVAKTADGLWAPDPDPVKSAANIREVFLRMGFHDEHTVALIGGGHAFGKTHGACPAGPGPSPLENVTNPWPGACGSGTGADTFTSGFEGPWTTQPTKWGNQYFVNLLDRDWEKHKGPGGHWQWRMTEPRKGEEGLMRLTTDMALVHDREYKKIVKEFAEHPHRLDASFADAWFKLTTNGGYWSRSSKCLHHAELPIMLKDDVQLVATASDASSVDPSWAAPVAFVALLSLALLLSVSKARGNSVHGGREPLLEHI